MKKTLILQVISCLMFYHCSFSQEDPGREDWIPLFNGKDLSGWHPKIKGFRLDDNYLNTFRVEAGVLKANTMEYPEFNNHFGHIFYEKPFSFYRMTVEYRFFGKQARNAPAWAVQNSGIMIHCQPPESMAPEQDFPISIEVQLLADDGSGSRPTANVCTPGTEIVIKGKLTKEHCIVSSAATYKPDEWVRAEILVLGDSLIVHYINGKEVLRYSKPRVGGGVVNDYFEWAKIDGTALTGGYISLQSESQPVEFRKVELLNLEGCADPKARNYKSYYVKADNSKCIY